MVNECLEYTSTFHATIKSFYVNYNMFFLSKSFMFYVENGLYNSIVIYYAGEFRFKLFDAVNDACSQNRMLNYP